MTLDALGLARLLQLASPALPVGAYSYSGGLESALEDRLVVDAAGTERWIGDVLDHSLATFEAPVLWRLSAALAAGDWAGFKRWNTAFRAGRESAELRAETLQMGRSLRILLAELPFGEVTELTALEGAGGLTFPAAFSYAAHVMKIDAAAALLAYLWSWLENQVMAALKASPLGQTAGQKILAALGARLPAVAQTAMQLNDDELSNFAPGLAIASCRHETQYSRLFRS
jgi:urease accessory protein